MKQKPVHWQAVENKQKKSYVVDSIDINKIESKLPSKLPRSHSVVISLENLYKAFKTSFHKTYVLKDINLSFYAGEFVIVYGPSGCGKSTLLHTILGLEEPSKGKVFLRDVNLYRLNQDKRSNFRRQKIGIVFQQSNWIKSLSVLDNVAYPLWLDGYQEKEAREKALETLTSVGMEKFAKQKPSELSGGQQQKVALARALVTDPWVIICDEPTGNLDSLSSSEIMTLLAKLNRIKRRLVIMVTHDMSFLPLATRRVAIKDGSIVHDEKDSFSKKLRL